MEAALVNKARELLNANYISTTLSTVDRDYNCNIGRSFSVLEMIDDKTIICARFWGGATYANLQETGKGVFLVLLTDNEKTKDGIRVYVKLVDDQQEGPYYERMKARLANTRYSSFPLKNCLVFEITDIRRCQC